MACLCKKIGHDWQRTTAPGWFRCRRSDCPAMIACPGCLGYRVAAAMSDLCEEHKHLRIQDFPLSVGPAAPSFVGFSGEQGTLF